MRHPVHVYSPSDEDVAPAGAPVSLLLSSGCGIGGVRNADSSLPSPPPASPSLANSAVTGGDLRARLHAVPAGSRITSVRKCARNTMTGAMKDMTADF